MGSLDAKLSINKLDVRTVQVNTHRSNAINPIKGGTLIVEATIDKNKDTLEDSERNTNVCTRIENGTKLNTYAEMASLYSKKKRKMDVKT
ncbi:hypothetical protein GJ496_009524 [Pomphorhynchus laevis]|nr:hypothetical protein GJ496_009524 [Pomphorhynchus laevis]